MIILFVFNIGEILAILCQNADSVDVSDGIELKVRIFYRYICKI